MIVSGLRIVIREGHSLVQVEDATGSLDCKKAEVGIAGTVVTVASHCECSLVWGPAICLLPVLTVHHSTTPLTTEKPRLNLVC